jgi:hypothetical protein
MENAGRIVLRLEVIRSGGQPISGLVRDSDGHAHAFSGWSEMFAVLARSIVQAPPPKRGQVIFEGQDLVRLPPQAMKSVRRDLQMVFQDPFRSLDPKWTVSRIVAEPLTAYGIGSRTERRERVRSLLDLVGLDPASYGRRRPRELSGGQAQRVAIARALVLEPKLILCRRRSTRRAAAGSAPAARRRRNAARPRRRHCARWLTGARWPVTSRCPRWPPAKPPLARRPLVMMEDKNRPHYCQRSPRRRRSHAGYAEH